MEKLGCAFLIFCVLTVTAVRILVTAANPMQSTVGREAEEDNFQKPRMPELVPGATVAIYPKNQDPDRGGTPRSFRCISLFRPVPLRLKEKALLSAYLRIATPGRYRFRAQVPSYTRARVAIDGVVYGEDETCSAASDSYPAGSASARYANSPAAIDFALQLDPGETRLDLLVGPCNDVGFYADRAAENVSKLRLQFARPGGRLAEIDRKLLYRPSRKIGGEQ